MDLILSKLQETVKDRKAEHAAVHGVTKSQTRLSDQTTILLIIKGGAIGASKNVRMWLWCSQLPRLLALLFKHVYDG